MHSNDDKSRGFEDTGQQRDKRRRGGGFNDPLTARRADTGQTSASARSGRRKGGKGEWVEGRGEQRKREKERECVCVCACVIQRGKKRTIADKDGRGGGGVKESCREKEYIAVIIAIDFYRQTITPGAPDGYPRRSGDAFFSFSFPSASLPSPFFTPSLAPVSPTLVPDVSHVAMDPFVSVGLFLCISLFIFML